MNRFPAAPSTVADPDDLDKNHDSAAPHLADLVAQRVARRHFLRSGVGAMASVGLGSLSLAACGGGDAGDGTRAAVQSLPVQADPAARWRATSLDFEAVGKSIADTLVLPDGYQATVVHATGDSIDANVPDYAGDGSEATYSRRVGDHHDGMNFFPLAARQDRPDANNSQRGILVVNHENITGTAQFLHPAGETNLAGGGPRPADEVIKEQEAHGVSLSELQRAADGRLRVVKGSRYNRRVTARTEVDLAGPVAGTHWVKTKYSPTGTRARGTINNCGNGVTPWGTYLAAEENWAGYFKRNAGDDAARPQRENTQLLRNGMRPNSEGFAHRRWASVEATGDAASDFERWNISVIGASATDDYRNEHNTFGYIVEIDPYAPLARPKKRTAMGRRANEGAWSSLPKAGRPIAFYVGCDSQNEYVYKYVSDAAWSPSDAFGGLAAGDKYLDRGTIYAAVFEADGTGRWEPLTLANPKVAAGVPVSSYNPAGYQFESLADICVNTRLAAGAAGATRMDRPEWTAVNPFTGEIYITMTENPNRGNAGLSANNIPNGPVDAANPRSWIDTKGATSQGPAVAAQRGNVNGHIVRIREDGDDAAALSFRWDIFLFGAQAHKDAGIPDSTYTEAFYQANVNLSGLTDANDLSKPDGCWFSQATGILYIETDDNTFTDQTNAQLLACIPGTLGDGGPVEVENLANGSPDANVRAAGGSSKQTTLVGRRQTEATLKRLLVAPRGAEITGLAETPDGRTLFVNIQHPGENTGRSGAVPASVALTPATPNGPFESNFPGNLGYGPGGATARPRSATIAITRVDGGVIGWDPDKPNKGGRA